VSDDTQELQEQEVVRRSSHERHRALSHSPISQQWSTRRVHEDRERVDGRKTLTHVGLREITQSLSLTQLQRIVEELRMILSYRLNVHSDISGSPRAEGRRFCSHTQQTCTGQQIFLLCKEPGEP